MSTQNDMQEQLETAGKTACERIKLLFRPFINYRVDDKTGEWSITVVPESVRAWFYVEFWIFSFIGVFMTHAFSKTFSATNNPILETFGNNNICVYYDDPPFSYIGAALFVPIILTGVLYLFSDLTRVYSRMIVKKGKEITPRFYFWYKAVSIFIALCFIFFVQVFATQPTQDIVIHWIPFGFLQWALFLLGVQHYVYLLKIKVISPDTKNYWIGILYLVLMGLDVCCKFFLDTYNVSGGKLWNVWGDWVKGFASAVDAVFMVLITICPIFIYLVFVTHLDHVQFTFKGTASYAADDDKKDDVEMQQS